LRAGPAVIANSPAPPDPNAQCFYLSRAYIAAFTLYRAVGDAAQLGGFQDAVADARIEARAGDRGACKGKSRPPGGEFLHRNARASNRQFSYKEAELTRIESLCLPIMPSERSADGDRRAK